MLDLKKISFTFSWTKTKETVIAYVWFKKKKKIISLPQPAPLVSSRTTFLCLPRRYLQLASYYTALITITENVHVDNIFWPVPQSSNERERLWKPGSAPSCRLKKIWRKSAGWGRSGEQVQAVGCNWGAKQIGQHEQRSSSQNNCYFTPVWFLPVETYSPLKIFCKSRKGLYC